jgi:hypothetical protein
MGLHRKLSAFFRLPMSPIQHLGRALPARLHRNPRPSAELSWLVPSLLELPSLDSLEERYGSSFVDESRPAQRPQRQITSRSQMSTQTFQATQGSRFLIRTLHHRYFQTRNYIPRTLFLATWVTIKRTEESSAREGKSTNCLRAITRRGIIWHWRATSKPRDEQRTLLRLTGGALYTNCRAVKSLHRRWMTNGVGKAGPLGCPRGLGRVCRRDRRALTLAAPFCNIICSTSV